METPDASLATTSVAAAPYGHACANCARAKCRCILRAGTETCERCHRLGRPCNPSAAVRKSAYRARKPIVELTTDASGRVQKLEERLDELASVVHNLQSQSEHSDGRSLWPPLAGEGETYTVSVTENDSPASFPSSQLEGINSAVAAITAAPSDTDLRPEDAGECLRTFRTQHLQFFPLVYIPTTTMPGQLQQERPFLWLCISAICTKSVEQQAALGLRTREILARQLLVEAERSTDLLLGLLTLVSWGRFFDRGKPEFSVYLSLASSMISDLGIDRSYGEDPAASISCFSQQGHRRRLQARLKPTNEHRRALLACFVMNSFASSLMKFDSLRWRPYIEGALQNLSDNPECPGDQVLIAMARIAKVSQDASGAINARPDDDDAVGVPILHVKLLRSSLEYVRSQFSQELLQNKVILTYLYSTEALINGIALVQRGPHSLYNRTSDSRRLEILHQCLQSAKSTVETYLSFAPDVYPGMNIIFMMFFRHGTQLLYKLLILDDPEWDQAWAREEVDVVRYLKQAAEKCDVAVEIAGSVGNSAVQRLFSKASTRLRASIPAWAVALQPAGDITEGTAGNLYIDGIASSEMMDFADDIWLADTITSWQE